MSENNIIFNAGVKFPSLIIPTGSQPLDSRTIVQNLPTHADEFTEGAVYLGMTVSCLNDKNFYMLEKIENGELSWKQVGKETDLSNYYTKSQVDAKVKAAIDAIPDVDFTGYATETYVNTKIAAVKDASYAYATNIGISANAAASAAASAAQTASYAYASKEADNAQAASYAYAEAKFNALLGDGKLVETIDTVKEISYWLDNNPNDAVELTLSLAELTEKVNDNEKVVATSINTINSKLTWGVI